MESRYSKNLCAFIDILGYKQLVESAEKSNEPLKIIFNLENMISEAIEKYIESRNKYKDLQISYEIFSDSIIITSALNEDETEEDMCMKIFDLALIVAGIQVQALNWDILFRGAISIGNHYRSSKVMFSKALTNAYMAEENNAIFPRVIIDTQNSKDKIFNSKRVLDGLLNTGLLAKYNDIYFIDYLGRAKSIGILGEEHRKMIISNLDKYKESERVFEKYIWLASYYNLRVAEDDIDIIPINKTLDDKFKFRVDSNPGIIILDENNEVTVIDINKMKHGETIYL